jgi:predicted  nucleic acid-binding Zn-ribbon protein
LNEQLSLLISLQEIDSAILSIAEEIELLPNKLEKAKARLKEINTSFEKVNAEYEKSDKEKKQKEDGLEELQEKINKFKAKSKEIKTNKEYEAHLKEVQTFENNKYQIEEEILSIMETLDALAKDLKKEETRFKKSEENFKQEGKVLEERKNKLYSEMEMYKIKRKDLVKEINEEIYEKYMNIIKSAKGVAVVQTRDEVCLGCHTNIPPQLYNDIKNGEDIFTCYHCNRFLYYFAPGESARGEKEK